MSIFSVMLFVFIFILVSSIFIAVSSYEFGDGNCKRCGSRFRINTKRRFFGWMFFTCQTKGHSSGFVHKNNVFLFLRSDSTNIKVEVKKEQQNDFKKSEIEICVNEIKEEIGIKSQK